MKPDFEFLRAQIVEITPKAEPWVTDSKTDLFDVGALDSVTIMELVMLLEKRLDFVFDFTDFKAVHFRNIETLQSLLRGKYGFHWQGSP